MKLYSLLTTVDGEGMFGMDLISHLGRLAIRESISNEDQIFSTIPRLAQTGLFIVTKWTIIAEVALPSTHRIGLDMVGKDIDPRIFLGGDKESYQFVRIRTDEVVRNPDPLTPLDQGVET
jgi:hypothetical protein